MYVKQKLYHNVTTDILVKQILDSWQPTCNYIHLCTVLCFWFRNRQGTCTAVAIIHQSLWVHICESFAYFEMLTVIWLNCWSFVSET